MFKKAVLSLPLLAALLSTNVAADNFNICPKGFFVNDGGSVEFKANYFSDYKLCSTDRLLINFIGPIFPPYKLPKAGKTEVDNATGTLTALQANAELKVDVTKKFTLVNGGILSTITYQPQNGAEVKGPVRYRMILPIESFAGTTATYGNGKQLELPKEKSAKYILFSGKNPEEFRFALSPELEIGLKLISGMGDYQIADCRHHGNNGEKNFHIYITMSGNTLTYFVCLLKPGEPFPSVTPGEKPAGVPTSAAAPAVTASPATASPNLLGTGSGFEVGPHGMRPFAAYSWDEAWTSSGIQPVFDDKVAVQGKYSLKLTAEDIKPKQGRFNHNCVWFAPVRLNPAKTYTLSAWMKSDIDGTRAIMAASEPWLNELQQVFPVSTEWKKYAFTFQPEKYKLLNFRRCTISIGGNKGSLWIDNVQLQEGGGGDYRPEPLELGAAIDQPYKLFTPAELPDGTIKLWSRNNTGKDLTATVNYTIRDYWDNVVDKGAAIVKTGAESNSQTLIRLPALPCGYYRASLDSADGKFHDEAIFGVYEPVKSVGKLPQDWPLGCHNSEGNPLIRKLGFGWTRGWEFSFKNVSPEPGKFDFSRTDIIVDRCRKAGLNLMPIIGPDFARNHYDKDGNPNIPVWAIEKTQKSSVKNSHVLDLSFPRMDAWKTYVKALVSHYKKDIKVWEDMNEPNCWLTPEEYAPYLKATYEAAKAADPDCVIVGICSTSDWGGEPAPWTKRVMELDKCQSMDVLSIHMYCNTQPEEYMNIGTNVMLANLKKEMEKYGKKLPIWHTEKSHNTTTMGYSDKKLKMPPVYLREPGFRVPDFRAKTEYLIRETLIDSCSGNGPFFWFGKLPNDIFIMSQSNEYGLGHTEFDGSPCPEILAANGLARMLEGRGTPKELCKLDASKYAAIYEGKDGTLAAIWDSAGKSEVKLPGNIGAFSLYNMFGTAIDKPANNSLKLSGAPVYLKINGKSAAEVKALLLQSETNGKKFTLSGGLELEGNTPVMAVYAFNKTLTPITTTLALNGQFAVKNTPQAQNCPPGQYSRTVFAIDLPDKLDTVAGFNVSNGKESSLLSIVPYQNVEHLKMMLSNSQETTAYKVPSGQITIDGNLSEWDGRGWCGAATANKVAVGRQQWQDPADLSCAMRLRWDAGHLYIAAVVYDQMVERNAPDAKSYASDGIELFLGLDPASKTRATTSKEINRAGPNDFQILLAPGMKSGQYLKATGWVCQKKSPAGINIASKLSTHGYTLEAAIPWQSLNKEFQAAEGKELLLAFQANDTDTPEQPARKSILWAGDENNWMSPHKWGKLSLR